MMTRYYHPLLAVLLVFVFGLSASAATYYIDYSSGNDSSSGTAKTTPWKHAPGMVGCTAACASAAPAAGDSIILKGGVSWPNAVFPMSLAWSGNSSNSIYVGVDQTWYSGASWARPIFNAGGSPIAGTYNIFLYMPNQNYVTVDNIEWTGFSATTNEGFGDCAHIQAVGGTGLLIENNYFHHFSAPAVTGGNCYIVQGATYSPFAGNSVIEDNIVAGDGTSLVSAFLCFGTVKNNVIHDVVGMIYPCGHGEISGNLLYNCGYPSFPSGTSDVHADAIQSDVADGVFYIHDNVIHDTGNDTVHASECEAMLIGNPNETDYVWNNVIYNVHGNAPSLIQNSSPGLGAYFWNNTITGGQDGEAYCVRAGHSGTWPTIVIENNHCLTSAGRADDPALSASTKTVSNNLTQTISVANGQGFAATPTYAYSPTASSNATVGAGLNQSSRCSATLAGLCSDTSYGCTVNAQNQVSCPARVAVARPGGSTAWDAGAFQFTLAKGAGPTPPNPPTSLSVTVQ